MVGTGTRQARDHELEHDDLRERVLQRDPIGIEVGVGPAPLEPRRRPRRVAEVVHEDLLGERERTPEPLRAWLVRPGSRA